MGFIKGGINMSIKKETKKKGYPFKNTSSIKLKDKSDEEKIEPKSPPRYGVYKLD